MTPDLFSQPEFYVHKRESSPVNEAILNENRKRLSNNCRTLYEAMMRGGVLNSIVVSQKYGIIDWRRRRCDLEENGIKMRFEKSNLGKGLRDWFMNFEDKEHNRLLIIC